MFEQGLGLLAGVAEAVAELGQVRVGLAANGGAGRQRHGVGVAWKIISSERHTRSPRLNR